MYVPKMEFAPQMTQQNQSESQLLISWDTLWSTFEILKDNLIIVDNAKDIRWSVLQWIDDQRWVDGCRRPDDRIMKRWRDNWLPNYSHQIQQDLCV